MKFWEAMKLVDEGKKVYKKGGFDAGWVIYKSTEAEALIQEKPDTDLIKFATISPVSMCADDWIEYIDMVLE